ncbi:MAG: DUF4229 domain-containing protein [Nakamurella sp.]
MRARSFWPLAVGYVALRILLTVLIAALVVLLARLAGLDMPVLVAAMLAVIVQLPLAWLILGGMRRRLTAQLAASAGERRQLRGELRAALSGERTSSADQAAGDRAAAPEQAASDEAASTERAAPEQAGSADPMPTEEPVVSTPNQATRP